MYSRRFRTNNRKWLEEFLSLSIRGFGSWFSHKLEKKSLGDLAGIGSQSRLSSQEEVLFTISSPGSRPTTGGITSSVRIRTLYCCYEQAPEAQGAQCQIAVVLSFECRTDIDLAAMSNIIFGLSSKRSRKWIPPRGRANPW